MPRIGGESNLIVHNDVDGTVSRVIRQVGEMHRLENNTLTTERGVSMQENRHHLRFVKRLKISKKKVRWNIK